MALVSFLPPTRVAVPHETGAYFDFKRPNAKAVARAREIAEAKGRQGIRDLGADIFQALQAGNDDEKAVRRAKMLSEAQEYTPAQFDRDALLAASIVGWSYLDERGKPVPVTPDTLADLDEATSAWAMREVVQMIAPRTGDDDKSPA